MGVRSLFGAKVFSVVMPRAKKFTPAVLATIGENSASEAEAAAKLAAGTNDPARGLKVTCRHHAS
jgi:hypothetical protein